MAQSLAFTNRTRIYFFEKRELEQFKKAFEKDKNFG
jgi:hypothetical protein